ncbi:MAG: rhomboid family intramembrane serine protease [Hyphomicrobiales bacterium]
MDMRTNPAGGAGQKIINSPPIVLALIAILLAIHLALVIAGEDWQVWTLAVFGFNPLRWLPNTQIAMVAGSQYWSFLTYALLHGNWMHVIVNCLWLLIFGTPVARLGGTWRFLVICAAGAAGGALATLVLHWGQDVNLVGASGAISGLLAASVPILYGAASPNRYLLPGEMLKSRNALVFMGVWLAITLVTGSANMTAGAFEGLQVAWEAHIGGFLFGLIAFYLVMPRVRYHYS